MTKEVDSSMAKPRLGVMCVHCRGGEGGQQGQASSVRPVERRELQGSVHTRSLSAAATNDSH
jgi:hypothetical protein